MSHLRLSTSEARTRYMVLLGLTAGLYLAGMAVA